MKDLLTEISEAVGSLSDLRYGRFSKAGAAGEEISEEVLATLKRLEAACEDVEK